MQYYSDRRKIAIVGAGMVGMSFAYSLVYSHVCDELVIVDIDEKRAEGEAMDLNHGLAFSGGNMKIYAADYDALSDADIVVISAGVAQKPGESRIALLRRNARIMASITDLVCKSGFDGIFLIATNPVDIMTDIVRRRSGFPSSRVIGSGTTLDTARLRYEVGSYLGVDPRNIHAYVMGEHGDSEFVPWSQAYVSTKSLLSICQSDENDFNLSDLNEIEKNVRTAAQAIIEAKGATYYGIGLSILRIVRAILSNERSILTVSARLEGEYGEDDVYIGVPCLIGREGIKRVVELDLTPDEIDRFAASADFLRSVRREILRSDVVIQ